MQQEGTKEKLKVNTDLFIYCDCLSQSALLQEPVGDSFPHAFFPLNCFALGLVWSLSRIETVSIKLVYLDSAST